MVTMEFAPKSHWKVALGNLTLVLMQSARKRTRPVDRYECIPDFYAGLTFKFNHP
jgi:hypothetical protein